MSEEFNQLMEKIIPYDWSLTEWLNLIRYGGQLTLNSNQPYVLKRGKFLVNLIKNNPNMTYRELEDSILAFDQLAGGVYNSATRKDFGIVVKDVDKMIKYSI
jgi:hypothetical protein